MDSHKLFGKRPSAFPHSHRPGGAFTQREIGEFGRCGFLLKTVSSLTEVIHFGNDVHSSVATVSRTWMLCVGTVDAFRSESLVGLAGIRIWSAIVPIRTEFDGSERTSGATT